MGLETLNQHKAFDIKEHGDWGECVAIIILYSSHSDQSAYSIDSVDTIFLTGIVSRYLILFQH